MPLRQLHQKILIRQIETRSQSGFQLFLFLAEKENEFRSPHDTLLCGGLKKSHRITFFRGIQALAEAHPLSDTDVSRCKSVCFDS